MLTGLADPAQYPYLFAAMQSAGGESDDREFGLQLILDGIASRATGSP